MAMWEGKHCTAITSTGLHCTCRLQSFCMNVENAAIFFAFVHLHSVHVVKLNSTNKFTYKSLQFSCSFLTDLVNQDCNIMKEMVQTISEQQIYIPGIKSQGVECQIEKSLHSYKFDECRCSNFMKNSVRHFQSRPLISNMLRQASMYLHSAEGVKSVTLPSRDSCHAGTAVKGGLLLRLKLLKFTEK